MPAPKGRPKYGGRKKGTPNKLTAALKAMVARALEREGGVEYLREIAREDPAAFLALLGKILPREVKAGIEARRYVVEIKASASGE